MARRLCRAEQEEGAPAALAAAQRRFDSLEEATNALVAALRTGDQRPLLAIHVNPNDHVNFGQSTNDVYPTAFHLGLILRLGSYMEALRQLQEAFFAKGREFDQVLKMGRTHLQDAVPMSLGAEFHGWGTTIGEEVNRIAEVRQTPPVRSTSGPPPLAPR